MKKLLIIFIFFSTLIPSCVVYDQYKDFYSSNSDEKVDLYKNDFIKSELRVLSPECSNNQWEVNILFDFKDKISTEKDSIFAFIKDFSIEVSEINRGYISNHNEQELSIDSISYVYSYNEFTKIEVKDSRCNINLVSQNPIIPHLSGKVLVKSKLTSLSKRLPDLLKIDIQFRFEKGEFIEDFKDTIVYYKGISFDTHGDQSGSVFFGRIFWNIFKSLYL